MIRRTRSAASVLLSRDVLRGLSRGAAVLALLLAASPSAAQVASPQVRDDIQRNTRPGDRLTLDIRGGPEVRGRLLSTGADALVLERDGQQQSFEYVSIDRVRRRRNGVWLGTIIGLGAGLAAGLPMRELANNETGGGGADLAKMVALGVGAGILVDGLLSRNRTIYRRPASPLGIAVAPHKAGGAIHVSARW